MGYPMAVNLRNGLSPEYTLLICDVNKEAISKFQKQAAGKGPVEVITNGHEAAKAAVNHSPTPNFSRNTAKKKLEHGNNNAPQLTRRKSRLP